MNFEIANVIKGYLVDKVYADRIVGIVKVNDVGTEGGKSVRYPIAYNSDPDECKKSSTYLNLVPDSKKKSVIYFEDQGVRKIGQQGKNISYQSSLILVGWLNGKKLGMNGGTISGLVVNDIIKSIPSGYLNSSPYVKIRINVTGQLPKSVNIFSRYTYDEKVLQYLMYPYDYFALTIVTDFDVNSDCVPSFDINNPVGCLNPTT